MPLSMPRTGFPPSRPLSKSLTLHGTFEEPSSASVVFNSDQVIDGKHTFLLHLETFRSLLVGHENDTGLYQSVTQFLRKREKLRRLDLGDCPWELVDLPRLRVLRVRIANLTQTALSSLVNAIPEEMVAVNLSTVIVEKPLAL